MPMHDNRASAPMVLTVGDALPPRRQIMTNDALAKDCSPLPFVPR